MKNLRNEMNKLASKWQPQKCQPISLLGKCVLCLLFTLGTEKYSGHAFMKNATSLNFVRDSVGL